MSHTPGPWKQSIDNGRVIESGRTKVAIASPTSPPPVAWANAKLIAAAPDLLRLLQESVSTLADTRRPIEDWLNEARETIRKANGVEQ